MSNAPASPAAPRDPFAWLYAHPLVPLFVLVCAQVLLRLALSPALDMDEAEQIVWTQHLAWGYGVQPPLYTWLQWGVNRLLGGQSVLALSLLKHSLLALTYVLLWHAARLQGLGARGAWQAAGGVLLFALVCWMAVRDLTHSVLLLTCSAGLYLALVRLLARPSPVRFAALGAALAAGMLAKYNFALIAAALLGAALLDATQRRVLFSRGWPLAPLAAALLVAPHLLWLAAHWGEIAARMGTKMVTGSGSGWPRLTALGQLASDLPTAVALWLAAMLACLGTGWLRGSTHAAGTGARLLVRYLLLVMLALLAVVLVATPARLTPRWLEPLLMLLPMTVFLRHPELEQHPRGHWLTVAICTAALLGMGMAAARPAWHLHKGRPDELNTDPLALAQAALDAGYDGVQPIVVTRLVPGGNLRLAFPHTPVLQCPRKDCKETLKRLEREGKGWLLVLDREAERRQQPPERLAGLREHQLPPLPSLLGVLLPPSTPGGAGVTHYAVWLKWQPPSK